MSQQPPAYTPDTLPDAETLYATLLLAVRQIVQSLPIQQVHLVGIHSGGAWLAARLHRDLKLVQPYGTLDISFYRDDFDKIGLHSQVLPSDISFPVTDKHLSLIDDVLYTGRTVRAALEGLNNFGRPRAVQLAVLVDRGHRELPIRPDYVGKNMPTKTTDEVDVSADGVIVTSAGGVGE